MQLLTSRPTIATATASINDRFWAMVITRLRQLAPVAQVWRLQAVRGRLALALASARRDELHSAEQYIEEARRLGESIASKAIALMATSALESTAAYLEYKRQNYDAALAALEHAKAADGVIERETQLVEWRLHRATLESNVAHVHARQGKASEAVERLTAIVQSFTNTPGQPGAFCDAKMGIVLPPAFLEELRLVYSAELAAMLDRFESDKPRR